MSHMIKFTDGAGKTIELDGRLTIADLVKQGVIGPNGWATMRATLPEPPQTNVYVAQDPEKPNAL